MPAWKIHRVVCEKLLGFYEPEIDRIVDFELGHDSSRYDADKLVEAVNIVKEKYGKIGLKQLILHHYLDRIQDLMISYKAGGVKHPKMFEIDERNIFNLIIHPFDFLEKAIYNVYSKIPSGKSRRSRRKEAIGKLRETHERLKKNQELMNLKPFVQEIIQIIKDNFEFITKCIEQDERTYKRAEHAKFLGQIMGKLMTKLSYDYRKNLLNQKIPKGCIMNRSNESDFRKILARKILQLDDLYSTSNDLKSKAQILSQMIQIIKEINPNVINEEIEDKYGNKRKLYDVAYDMIDDATRERGRYMYANVLSWLDIIRAKILSYLAKEKLITIDDFKKEKE